MSQLPLFEVEACAPAFDVGTVGTVNDRFLTANAEAFDCLTRSKTLATLTKQAVDKVRIANGGKTSRTTAKQFEEKLRALIIDPANAAKISSEVLAYAEATYPSLRLVKFRVLDSNGGTGAADIVVELRREGRKTARVAVNIKRLVGNATDAVSLAQFLQLATEPDFDPVSSAVTESFDTSTALLEMLSGRRRIQADRDYWMLVARIDKAGDYTGVEAWGSMVHTNKAGRTILTRHASRAVVRASKPAGMLTDAVDPNLDIADKLLPKADVAMIRAQLVAAVRDHSGQEVAQKVAGQLLDIDDAEMLGKVLGSLGITLDD
jgi:hypothetical protein